LSSSVSSPLTGHPPLVDFTSRFVQPPGQFYVTADDGFSLRIASSLVGARFRLLARLLVPATGIHYWQQEAVTTVFRQIEQFEFQGLEGFLIGLNVEIVNAIDLRDWFFASVQLTRGIGPPVTDFHALAHGYVTPANPLLWPGGFYKDPVDGRGTPRLVTVPAPGAGNNYLQNVPTGARWRIQAGQFTFTTSATVATRRVVLQLGDSLAVLYVEIPSPETQAASLTRTFSLAPWGFDAANRSNRVILALPDSILLAEGDELRSNVVSIQAGDVLSDMNLLVEEWFAQATSI